MRNSSSKIERGHFQLLNVGSCDSECCKGIYKTKTDHACCKGSSEKLLIAFLQSFVSNLINVGIKHIPLGQSEGQKILINFLPVIEKQANMHKIAKVNNLGSSAFLSDLSSMYHETLNNRIYQT